MWDYDSIYWDIYFDSIYLILKDNTQKDDLKVNINGYGLAEINLDISFIVGPNNYFESIKNHFFNKYKDICTETFLSNTNFRYIECDNNDLFNISSFPNVYFEHKELETIFNLTYEDLFILDKTKNKYLFLVFNNRFTNNWVFGNIFLRKYQFTFDVDSKTIGYYKSMNYHQNYNSDDSNDNEDKKDDKEDKKDDDNNNEQQKNEENDKNENNKDNNGNNKNNLMMMIIIGLLFVICCISFIFIGMYIEKKCNRRKKRINELEDENSDYNYIEYNNNLMDDSNKKSKEKNSNEYNIN